MIGIIGAMEKETQMLAAAMETPQTETISGITYVCGRLEGQAVVVATCGIGKVFAAVCAQTMILRYQPALLINTGIAGTLSPALGIGDVAVADRLVQHDMDTSPLGDPPGMVSGIDQIFFPSDPAASQALAACVAGTGRRVLSGTIASGDQFIAASVQKERIATAFGAIACEMEGAAIAHVATINRVPFAVLRTISDSADGAAAADYPAFASATADMAATVVRRYLATCRL